MFLYLSYIITTYEINYETHYRAEIARYYSRGYLFCSHY